MAGEITLRLSLRGRREVAEGLRDTADAAREVGREVRDAGWSARDAAGRLASLGDRKVVAGLSGMAGAARGLAGTLAGGLVGGAKAGAVALGGLAVGMGALSVKAIGLATDAGETASAFGTVFAGEAANTQKTLDAMTAQFGLYGPEMQDAARQFGVFGKAAGVAQGDLGKFSTDLVQAGADLGSFYNVDAAEAFAALQSGLSGEAEPLRRFGIFLSDATMQAQAATMGLTGDLTESQKVMVRQAYILSHLGDAQGDLARTSGGLANQQRAVENRAKTLATTFGTALIPAASGLARALNTGLQQAIDALQPRLPAITAGAERFGNELVRVGGLVPGLVASLGDLRGGDAQGVAEVLDAMLGDDSPTRVEAIRTSIEGFLTRAREVSTVLGAWRAALPSVVTPLGLLWQGFQFGAQHTTALKIVLGSILPVWAAYRIGLVAARVATVAHGVATGVLAVAQRGNAAATIAANGATRANTVGMVAARVVTVGMRVATLAWSAAQWVLNAALRANPIGLVITALTLLVGGIVLAYKRSETFRGIVDTLWGKIKEGGRWVGDLAGKVSGALVGAFRSAQDWAGRVRDKVGGFVDKVRDAIRWVGDLAGRVRNLPGIGAILGALGVPGREHGGPVAAGQPYVVGERRPELFVPQVPGVILPRVPAPPAVAGGDGVGALSEFADGRPVVVQLVVDRRVLAESTVDGLRAREARR